MPSYVPPKRATAFVGYFPLFQQANPRLVQVNPTIAAADFSVSLDGGAFNALTTTPTVTPAGGATVLIQLSALEMTADNVVVRCSDAAGAQWCDLTILLQTSEQQIDTLATQANIGAAGAGLTALGDVRLANLDAAVSSRSVYAGGAVASVTGDVGGKVIGGGVSAITGTGARVVDAAGNNVAPAATALSTAEWTALRAAALDNLDATISGVAAAVWTYGTRTLTSLATLVASIAAAVWTYATRTLTQSAASVAAAVAGTTVTVQHATKWVVAITGLGSLADRDDLLLTVKDREGDTDALAVLQVSENNGLIRLNGAAVALPITAAKASLVVDDPVAGNITLTVSSDVTALIGLSAARIWDVKRIYDDPATVGILDDMPASGVGAWVVAPIVTRTIS